MARYYRHYRCKCYKVTVLPTGHGTFCQVTTVNNPAPELTNPFCWMFRSLPVLLLMLHHDDHLYSFFFLRM